MNLFFTIVVVILLILVEIYFHIKLKKDVKDINKQITDTTEESNEIKKIKS